MTKYMKRLPWLRRENLTFFLSFLLFTVAATDLLLFFLPSALAKRKLTFS